MGAAVLDKNSFLDFAQRSTLEEEVFLNELILSTIFQNFTCKTLLLCRLVHPIWRNEATKTLQKDIFLKEIKIGTNSNPVVTLDRNTNSNFLEQVNSVELNSFTQLVCRSFDTFPCNNFCIHTNQWDDEKYQDFFENCGAGIRRISLCFRCVDSLEFKYDSVFNAKAGSLVAFQTLLEKQLPNLNILELKNIPKNFDEILAIEIQGNSKDKTSKNNSLKSLKILKLPPDYVSLGLLNWILKQAKNLTEIRNSNGELHEETLNLLLKMEKVHLIKDMSFDSQNIEDNIDLYFTLAKMGLKLENIVKITLLDNTIWMPKIIQILKLCLNSSSSTLKTITGCFPIAKSFGVKFPQLTNLTQLEYCYRNLDSCKEFIGIDLGLKTHVLHGFSNLRSVTLNFEDEVFYFVEPKQVFCDQTIPIVSVTHLSFLPVQRDRSPIIVSLIPTIWFKYLREIFPNVRKLVLPRFKVSSFGFCSKILWGFTFPLLMELEIGIAMVKEREDLYLELDTAFTGFSKRQCAQLHSMLKSGEDIDVDALNKRRSLSILDLKYLKKLTIEFVYVNRAKEESPISEVSRKFAFGMCPNLKVNIKENFISTFSMYLRT